MPAVTSAVEIDCPPDKVFAVATDPRRFGEWQSDVMDVEMLDDGVFTTKRRMGGTVQQRIVRNDPPHDWEAESIGGAIQVHASIHVEPLDGGARSRVTFTLDFAGRGVGITLIPLIRLTAAKLAPDSYRALKRLVEEGSR
jgi:uncharacterized protein YndB with AHSA1/START domain